MKRASRLFFIFSELEAGGLVRTADVARRFNVDSRTVKRDIAFIKNTLGFPLVWSASSRAYSLMPPAAPGSETPAMAPGRGPTPFAALAIFKTILYGFLPEKFEKVEKRIALVPPLDGRPSLKTFMLLAGSLGADSVVRFDYEDEKGRFNSLSGELKQIVLCKGRWYAIVYDLGSKALKAIPMDKISAPAVEPAPFAHEMGPEVEKFVRNLFGSMAI